MTRPREHLLTEESSGSPDCQPDGQVVTSTCLWLEDHRCVWRCWPSTAGGRREEGGWRMERMERMERMDVRVFPIRSSGEDGEGGED